MVTSGGTDLVVAGIPEAEKLMIAGMGAIAGLYGSNRVMQSIDKMRRKEDFKTTLRQFVHSQFIDTRDNPRFDGLNVADMNADTRVVALLRKSLGLDVGHTHLEYADVSSSDLMTSAGPIDLEKISDFWGLKRVVLDSGKFYYQPSEKIPLPYYFRYHGQITRDRNGSLDVTVPKENENPGKEWFSIAKRGQEDEQWFSQKDIAKSDDGGVKFVYANDYLFLAKVRHPLDDTGTFSLINYPGIHDGAEFGMVEALYDHFAVINDIASKSKYYQAIFEIQYKYDRAKEDREHGQRPIPKSVSTELIEIVPLKEDPPLSSHYIDIG